MEAESALEMQEEQGTVQTDRGQDGPPTSMNPGSFENYSQVIFPNINNSYPPKTDILCTFHKRNKFKSGTKDWIGIFKVGWQNTKEYYTWVSLSTSVDNQVLFKAYYLPKDDEDYQFCYVDQNGDVRGVSTPFQFTVNEDENEIVMVTTMKENQDMNEMLKTQKAELQSATEKITTLEKENMDLLCQVKSAEGEKEMLTRKQLELDMEVYKLRDFEKELKQKFEAENKQLQDLQIKVKNLEEENETWHRKNLESELLLNKVQNLERELNQKIKDLENIKAENKQLQSDNEAKQQAVENLSDLLDNCKKEVTKMTAKLEVQTGISESDKRQKEEFQRSLEVEKSKVLDLESNLTKTRTMLRRAEDDVSKFQQQLTLQQKENATKDEEIKKIHLDIAHLQGNETKLKDKCEEHMQIISNEKKVKADLEQMLNRQNKKLLDLENKIKELKTDLRSAEETRTSMEQKLAEEQDENRKNKEHIMVLQSTVELREVEIADLNEITERKQAEVAELNSQLLRERFAASGSFSPTSQAHGLVYGNPYQEFSPRSLTQNEPLGHRLDQEELQIPTIQVCPYCSVEFQDGQVYEDHVMCHSIEDDN